MSKQVMAIGAVVVIALLGLFAYSQVSKPVSPASNVTQESSESGESMMQASIKSLIGAGKNVNCDITYTDGKGSGKIYVSDKKFRGDFDTIVNAKAYKSHMIQDGTNSYMWSDDSKQGTKFSVEAMEKVAASPNAQTAQSADINANVDMKCSSWSADNSMFTPPSDVTFQDMSAMMEKMTVPSGSGMPKTDASACDAITDAAAKAACMKAYGGQ